MTTHREPRLQPASPSGASHPEAAERTNLPRMLLLRAALGGAFLLVAMAVSLMLSSCGRSSGGTPVVSGADEAQAAEQPATASPNPPVQLSADAEKELATPVVSLPESLPPDIAITVTDTQVVPGENVDLLVQATVDVIGISLWDGLHDRVAFVYDGDAKAWRTTYRVPMGTQSERIALAVTARNDGGRWCRSWVFLNVDQDTPQSPDSLDTR